MNVDIEHANIDAAESGDRVAIELLLAEFSNNPDACSMAVRQFVAKCIQQWFVISRSGLKDGAPLDPLLAGHAFGLVRPAIRPKNPEITTRHLNGWKAYYIARMGALGEDAALGAGAKVAHMTQKAFGKTSTPEIKMAARLALKREGITVPTALPRKQRARNTKA